MPFPAPIRWAIQGVRTHFSSLASLGMRGLGVTAGFVVTVLIGRWYGPEANGQYAVVAQTALFLSVVAVGGLDLAVTREFSKSVAVGTRLSHTTLFRVSGQTMVVALLIITALTVAGEPLLELLGRERLPEGAVSVMCFILLARAFTRISGGILRSQKDYVLGQAVEQLFVPLFTIILLVVTGLTTVSGILWLTAGAGLLAALLGFGLCLRHTSGAPDALRISGKAVYATAMPLWGMAITANLADWYGLATVSAVNGMHDAGLFRVASQFASIFPILTMGLFGTFSAQISAAAHGGDMQKIATLARSAMRLSVIVVLPVVVLGFVFARQLLELVAPEFGAAAPLLRVLLVAQAVFAVSGISGLVLALAGWPKINFALSALTTIVIVAGAPWVAHSMGMFGVGVLVTLAVIGRYVGEMVIVRRAARIDVFRGTVIATGGVRRWA